MTKKLLIPIIAITTILITLMGLRMNTYSESLLKPPYPKYPESDPGSPSVCVQSMANEIFTMRGAYNANREQLKQQQKPTSKKTPEAYESMRTYRCWLDYLCGAVFYSGIADPCNPNPCKEGESCTSEDGKVVCNGNPLNKAVPFGAYLSPVPGCVSGDKIVIPGTKLRFMPECSIPRTAIARMSDADANYRSCRNLVALEFADLSETDTSALPSKVVEDAKKRSSAMIEMEAFLKNDSASQKGIILQNKIQSILTKLQAMGSHMDTLKEAIVRFDSKLSCYAPKCD